MEKHRCFIALDLPQEVKELLADAQTKLGSWPGNVKWVERGNIHLTLKFLGDVDVDRIPAIQNKLAELAAVYPAFSLSINGLGAFPSLRSPRVIWAGVADLENKLARLQKQIDNSTAEMGFPSEMKNFSPHLTLGRVKDSFGKPLNISVVPLPLVDQQNKQLAFPIKSFFLMRSILSPKGPHYVKLRSFPLQETLDVYSNKI